MDSLKEKKVNSKLVYDGILLKVNRDEAILPDGSVTGREWIAHPGAAAVIPLTDDRQVILVHQYRYPLQRVTVEIPAGKLDPGENPLICAKRELREETGMSAKELTYIGSFATTPAFTNEIIYLYLATGLMPGQDSTDPDEFIEVEKRPLTNLLNEIERGEIQDAKTIIALLMAAQKGLLK
ncbi:MAG TPA: NUDIX hydrolase [Bacillota bacterium]|jgi:ADP-ribose pyrophosphatase|nr:NUDIX hydrolase [Bacillota bacterium]